MSTVVAARNLETEFYKMIVEAQARLNTTLATNVEHHTVHTLAKYGRQLWSDQPIALQILRLAEMNVSAEPEDLEEIGNCALMFITWQLPTLKRRGLRREYFLNWGCFVYEQAAVCAPGAARRTLYQSLSDSFETTTKVVGDIFFHDRGDRLRQATISLVEASQNQTNDIILN